MEKMANIIPRKASRKIRVVIVRLVKNPVTAIIFLILTIAAFMRLYRISEYMTFLGDEGRDAIVARQILMGDFTLLGPRASAGDFFLGPIYYYMMAPFLWFFNYDPVGPAIMVALIGVATVFLVYYVSSKFFGKIAGITAAALYAVSPVVIAYSRSSWNPNPVPFFTLLMLYVLYLSIQRGSLKLFIVVGVLLGILLQLHYIAVFLGVIVFLFVLIGGFIIPRENKIKNYLLQYAAIFFGFLIGWFPFLLFEARHGFPNIKTIFSFIFVGNFQEKQIESVSHLEIVSDVFFRLYARLLVGFPPPEQLDRVPYLELSLLQAVTVILIIGSIFALIFSRKKLIISFFLIWLFGGVFLFGFYKKEIYDYYFGFLFPVPFILIGNLIGRLSALKGRLKDVGIFLGVLFFGLLFYLLIVKHPFQFTPNRQKLQAETIANFVLEKTNGKPFNFALITLGNSDHVFRYYFEIKNRAPVVIENAQVDPERGTVTDQLLVICEHDCKPIGNSLWEVAGFGDAEIEDQWKISFFTVYRLIPYGEGG